jgi:signal transduction histidine kinase
MLGRDARSLIGKHIWSEFPDGQGQKFQLAYEQAMREQRYVEIRDFYPPWNKWFENRIYPSPDGLSIFYTDITERMKMQEELRSSTDQLRALAARLDSIREEERRLIAREIHDQIGQALTALKLDLGRLTKLLDGHGSEAAAKCAEGMDALIDHTLDTARRVSAELRPAILDDLGLAAAIQWQSREFEERTGIPCELHLPSEGPALSPAIALGLYRIIQEALTNVVRHAEAHRVRIELCEQEDALVLTIADDGRGITAEELGRPTSLGVVGMRERALIVGGTIEITGSERRGTTVTARVPRLRTGR